MYKAPIGTRVDKTELVTKRIEDAIRRTGGRAQGRQRPARGPDHHLRHRHPRRAEPAPSARTPGRTPGSISVNLVPKSERRVSDQDIAGQVRQAALREFPGIADRLLRGRHPEAGRELRLVRARRRRGGRLRPRRRRGLRQAAGHAPAQPLRRLREGAPHRRADHARGELSRSSTWWWTGRRQAGWGSARRRWRRPCSPAWPARASSRPSRTSTPGPATSTTSTSAWTTGTAITCRTSRGALRQGSRRHPGQPGQHREHQALLGTGHRQPKVPAAGHRRHRQRGARALPGRCRRGRPGRHRRGAASGRLHRHPGRPGGRAAGSLQQPGIRGAAGHRAGLHDPRLAVPVAPRPAGDHVLGAPGHRRRHHLRSGPPGPPSRSTASWASS